MSTEVSSVVNVKCIVWDLDDTLWEGTLAEGGGQTLRPGVRELLRELDRRGVLHSIASKNEPVRAKARLAKLGVGDYFVCSQISWEAKSILVSSVAKELNVGLDTLVFIDDSPFERAEVNDMHPEVRCLDSADLGGLLDRPEFAVSVTAEAINRRSLYREATVRRQYEESFEGPRSEFLASLGMRLTVRRTVPHDLARAVELTDRTHQLNTTGLVFDVEQLTALMCRDDHMVLSVSLDDSFGDYGMVGLVLIAQEPGQWCIRLFLMSCRVMGRNVGGAILAFLAKEARNQHVGMAADFISNEVNKPMYTVYRLAGFAPGRSDGGIQHLRLRPGYGLPIPNYLTLNASL